MDGALARRISRPIRARRGAEGSRLVDIDGHAYVDLCLGDTGAMAGHSPPAVVRAVQPQVVRDLTAMLPTEDALWASEQLACRFGLPRWQFTLSATDANRCALRAAHRAPDHRSQKILVYSGDCDDEHGNRVAGTGLSRGAPGNDASARNVADHR